MPLFPLLCFNWAYKEKTCKSLDTPHLDPNKGRASGPLFLSVSPSVHLHHPHWPHCAALRHALYPVGAVSYKPCFSNSPNGVRWTVYCNQSKNHEVWPSHNISPSGSDVCGAQDKQTLAYARITSLWIGCEQYNSQIYETGATINDYYSFKAPLQPLQNNP